MGSYLSEPVCEKISSDESNDKLKCGASSMQGWRVSQEDAHNCILEFDNNCSFFAVYDGHGGHEVAQFCSQKLPEFIKQLQAYKDGDIKKALIEGFLGFDATIATKDVIAILKEIAGDKEAEEDEDDEENVDNLYKEATMPIEKVIEKYTNLVNPAVRNLKAAEGDKVPKSPNLKAKKETSDVGSSSSSTSEAGSSSGTTNSADNCSASDGVSSSCADSSEAKTADDEKKPTNGSSIPEIKISTPDSSDADKKEADAGQAKEEEKVETTPHQNGDVTDSQAKDDVSSSSPHENGDVSVKGKGKALAKKSVKTPQKVNTRPKRNANELYKQLLDFGGSGNDAGDSEEDSEDEDDKTFEGPHDSSDDDDGDIEDGINSSDDGSSCDEEYEDGDEEEEDEDDESYQFVRNMKEEPGSDSGCTAVVAFLKGNELYVANAGDSRCIVCRNGKAIEMSFDHKPEDDPERERVTKAGGKVTSDGRVNGGLNLSRAIGDHAYKQNAELSAREQMITALPDVKTCTVNPGEDEFMVLACDGIWNFMSSQEVVDFVRPRIETAEKLSTICEEMFDHCLAPNTMGDGTGCDNMTAIIVQFKSNILKRSASPEPEGSKRQKTEDAAEQKVESTAT